MPSQLTVAAGVTAPAVDFSSPLGLGIGVEIQS